MKFSWLIMLRKLLSLLTLVGLPIFFIASVFLESALMRLLEIMWPKKITFILERLHFSVMPAF